MDILYLDDDIVVCIKPPRVLSTDEPDGLPDRLRTALNMPNGDFRTVHRLDRVVGGVMVLARNGKSASNLSMQIRQNSFEKEYRAVIHGVPSEESGQLYDLLYRDKARRMTMVAQSPGKGVQEALLDYTVLAQGQEYSYMKVCLHTGRTHQIRVQFASRGMPLIGERKYSERNDPCEIALWSFRVGFLHPVTGSWMTFERQPPVCWPWEVFSAI